MRARFWWFWSEFITWLFQADSLSDTDLQSDPRYFARFPVFAIGLGVFWMGGVGLLSSAWHDALTSYASVLPLPVSLIYVCLGSAFFLSLSHPGYARLLAWLGALISGFEVLHWGYQGYGWSLVTRMHVINYGVYTVIAIVLVCATLPRLQRIGLVASRCLLIGCFIFWVFCSETYLEYRAPDSISLFMELTLVVMLALALGSVAQRPCSESPFAFRRFVFINVTGTLMAVSSWYFMIENMREARVHSASVTAQAVSKAISLALNTQFSQFDRMMTRWELLPQPLDINYIRKDLELLVSGNAAMGLLALLDAQYAPLEVIASSNALRDEFEHVVQDPVAVAALKRLSAQMPFNDRLASLYLPDLPQWSLLMVSLSHGSPGRFLVALYDPIAQITPLLSLASTEVDLSVRQDSRLLYDNGPGFSIEHPFGSIALAMHEGMSWTLDWWPKYPEQGRMPSLSDLFLLGGLLFTVLLSRFVHLSAVLTRHMQELSYQTLHDSITDLPNQRMLERYLTRRLDQADLSGQTVTIILLSVTGLKQINDSRGYQVGNTVLARVAQRIRSAVGDRHLIARFDRGEFVVVCYGPAGHALPRLIDEVVYRIKEPYQVQESYYHLDVCVGVSVAHGRSASSDELLREAELAAALARRDRKTAWQVYSEALKAPATARVRLSERFMLALQHSTLQLRYQPVVDVRSGVITAVQADLYWHDEEFGMVAPDIFIPLAEETGQAVALGHWVLQRVSQDMLLFVEKTHIAFPGTVTVSHLEFWRADFVESVRKVLQETRLSAKFLMLAVTEELLSANPEDSVSAVQKLHDMGVGVALQRLRVGGFSLRTLRKMSLRHIKIDPVFIKEVLHDADDAAITRSLISLAHQLDLRVVADGVETEAHYWFLRRNFCDEVQGALFGASFSAQELLALLQRTAGRLTLPMAPSSGSSDKVLLLLDDEPNILRALVRLLRRDGYRILTAASPEEAFVLLAEHPVQVVVSDQRMPTMTGTEFFVRVKALYPQTIRLVLSGYTDLKSVTDAINHGAIYRFLTKPWNDEELRDQVAQAFRTWETNNTAQSSS